ncbi:hypothetical protein [Planococcus sp. YIM B11945]|uniref:hypothetical protein n=1 Tax=Planococcus sp. YIM B11945 TaxID=3435410 RepID=UPI003D7E2B28
MDNKVFGLIFLAIMSSALLFFGVANAGAAAVDKWLFPTETFGEHTYIGTTDVSNMEVASAMAQFSGNAEAWKQTAELLVTYQDATASYPLDNAEILTEDTAAQAVSGSQNNLIYQLSNETTEAFLIEQFPVTEFSAAEVDSVTTKLEQALQSNLEKTHVTISDDSLSVNREVVSETSIDYQLKSAGVNDLLDALNELQIAPESKFSFLDFIAEMNLGEITDQELTEIASTIYSSVLQTNFSIDERSIGTSAPKSIPLGQEAVINRALGVDLVFTNPNSSSFTLNIDKQGDSLKASLSGFPFVYAYDVKVGSEEKVKPRLVKQFSAFASSGTTVQEEGSEGVRVKVLRTVVADGEELKVETVSTDFYPPVHRIEVYPLTAAADETAPVAPGSTTTGGTVTGDGQTSTTPAVPGTTDPTNPNTVIPGTTNPDTTTPDTDTATDPTGTDTGTADKDKGGTTPNSDNKPEPSEPEYDKGGNLITP